jgi:hypothetical protein
MADQNEVVVQFKAVVADFLDKMGAAHKGTQEAAQNINHSIEGIGKGFEKLMSTMGALAGILAGGAMFKEAIDKTLEWNGEVMKLSRTLGITSEDASGLAVALHHVGIGGDTFTGIAMKMTKQMRGNSEAFDKLGVSTKDSNGEWRNTSEVMVDAIEKLNSMQAGTDRNIAAQAMFGARVGDLGPLLRINKDLLEESAEKAKKYNLVVGPEGAAQTRAYKDAMKDVQLITQSLQVQIGNVLMPILLKLGQFLGENGPAMAEGFGYAIKGVVQVFYVLKAVIETITIVVTAAFDEMITIFTTLGKVMMAVMSGDFKGAVAIGKQGLQDLKAEDEAVVEGIKKTWADMAKNSKELWTDGPKKKSKAPEGDTLGGDDLKAGKKEKTNVVGEWEAELQKQKALLAESDGDLAEMAKEDERKFWLGKLALTKQGSAEWVAVRLKMAEDGKAIQKAEDEEAKKADKQASDLAKLTRQDEMAAAKNAMEIKKANLEAAVQMGQITHAQELAELKKFHAEELKIEIDALLAEQALHKDDPVKYAEIQNRILAAKRKSNLDIQKINTQAAQEEMKTWNKVADAITSSLGNAMQSLLTKTKSFGDAVQGLFQSLASSFSKLAIDMAMEWVKGELIKKAASVTTATTQATGNAVVAGSGAAASAASIPVYGWAIALAAGAAVLAGVMGMTSSIGSAEHGWSIPSGLNPMAQLHEEEMVLPKEESNIIRGMGKNGSGNGPQIHIHAMDAKSFKQSLRRNQGGLLQVLNQAVRNGRTS